MHWLSEGYCILFRSNCSSEFINRKTCSAWTRWQRISFSPRFKIQKNAIFTEAYWDWQLCAASVMSQLDCWTEFKSWLVPGSSLGDLGPVMPSQPHLCKSQSWWEDNNGGGESVVSYSGSWQGRKVRYKWSSINKLNKLCTGNVQLQLAVHHQTPSTALSTWRGSRKRLPLESVLCTLTLKSVPLSQTGLTHNECLWLQTCKGKSLLAQRNVRVFRIVISQKDISR